MMRQLIVSIAKAEVGVREEPKDSNRGKRVQEYQAATWLDGTGWPWCAAFVDWVLRDAIKLSGKEVKWKRPKTAGAWDLLNWAKEDSGGEAAGIVVYHGEDVPVKAGDILVYKFSHCGIAVANEQNGWVLAVEGNTDSTGGREGGGVHFQRRQTGKIRGMIRIEEV